jgi:hypothetical protein
MIFELFYPAPTHPGGRGRPPHVSEPVLVPLDNLVGHLGIGHRNILVPLSLICTWWRSPLARQRAAHSGREFLNPAHSRYGKTKPYSITGPKTRSPGSAFTLRRNLLHPAFPEIRHLQAAYPQLFQSLQAASSLHPDRQATPLPPLTPVPQPTATNATSDDAAITRSTERVLDLILAKQAIGGDGRKLRPVRLVRAVDRGLLPEVVLRRISAAAERVRREKPTDRAARLVDQGDAGGLDDVKTAG